MLAAPISYLIWNAIQKTVIVKTPDSGRAKVVSRLNYDVKCFPELKSLWHIKYVPFSYNQRIYYQLFYIFLHVIFVQGGRKLYDYCG